MNLRRKLNAIERLHRAQNPCPGCAENGGIKAVLLEGAEPLDMSALSCRICGTPSKYQLVVRLMDEPVAAGATGVAGVAT